MTTIKLKNGSGAPATSDLVQGEPALDLTNKRLYTENASGAVIEIGVSPSTIDINAGTIDGAVIGGASAAAGTFTTFTSNGIDDNADALAMTISSSEDISIGSASNHSGARVVINDTPPTAFGSPMFQVGQETFTSGGLYSIGLGYTASGSDNPPVEISALTVAGGGSTKADLIFGTRSSTDNVAVTERMRIAASGAVSVAGALSKGSGSFKIDHPLEAKKDTHHLVHSFVEGPQADLIYRGKLALVDGSATVNLDDAARMSAGTFVLLNTNVQCFTSNESGWTAVKGSVSGNVLTITSQESCTDTVSWMVVGERCDQHMLDTEWTDSNGRVIVEPLKPE